MQLVFETQEEVRRLLVAGSELAREDFRLKRLLPQMKKAGETVPVFSRLAAAMEAVTDMGNADAPMRLLELSNLINAIVYTQGEVGIKGDMACIETAELSFSTALTYRQLKPVRDALISKGPGRYEIVKEAYESGLFEDLRLVLPAIAALGDSYGEMADLAGRILMGYGTGIVPVLKQQFDINGGKGHARIIDIISHLLGQEEKAFYLDAIEGGSADVKSSAIKALRGITECEVLLHQLSSDRRKEIRVAALYALSGMHSDAAAKRLFEVFKGKERELAVEPVKLCSSGALTALLLAEGKMLFERFLSSEKGFALFAKKPDLPSKEEAEYFDIVLACLEGKNDPEAVDFLRTCLAHSKHLQQFKVQGEDKYGTDKTPAKTAASVLASFGTKEADMLLEETLGKYNNCLIGYAFEASLRNRTPAYVYESYSRFVRGGRHSYEEQVLLHIMDSFMSFDRRYRYMSAYAPFGGSNHNRGMEIEWDPRWLKTLIGADALKHVCKLADKAEPACIPYLLSCLEKHKSIEDDYLDDIIAGLMQADYQDITQAVLQVLAYNFKRTGHYLGYYLSRFLNVLKLLPADSAKAIEDFAKDCRDEAAAKLFELAYHLRNKEEKR